MPPRRPRPPHRPPHPPPSPFTWKERGLGSVCSLGGNGVIQEPGIVPRDPEPDGARAGGLASNCRAPEWAGLGSPRGSPRVGAWTWGHSVGWGAGCRVTHRGFCRLSADCHPELLPPVGAGWGRFYWQGPEGRRAASLLTAQVGLSSWWPWELARRSTPRVADEDTEARGRWQGLGSALGFAALSGLAYVCGGGAVPGPGQGRPLSEPRWAGSS